MDQLDLLREDMAALKTDVRDAIIDANSRVLAEVGAMRLTQLHNATAIAELHTAVVGNGTKGLADRVSAVEATVGELVTFEEREHGSFRALLVGLPLVVGVAGLAVSAIKLVAG